MNLFETANEIKKEQESKARKGTTASLQSTITVPYFKALYRKGEAYVVPHTYKTVVEKGIICDAKKVAFRVKPLTGAFIITYATCFCFFLCKYNTVKEVVKKGKKEVEVEKPNEQELTVHVIQAFLQLQGFSLSDYAQGKTTGAKRIYHHLKAIARLRDIEISVDEKTGIVSGLTEEIASSVILAI